MSTQTSNRVRPTKKQRELLLYIEQFIGEHGYSPSYREIMNGLNYTSVATVSLHVGNLIRRGHLRKRDRSARSLEIVKESTLSESDDQDAGLSPEKWLIDKVDSFFKRLEAAAEVDAGALDELRGLIATLQAFELHTAAEDFIARLQNISQKTEGQRG